MRALSLILGCFAASFQAVAAAPMPGPGLGLPTYTPAYQPTTVDERGIWMQADERERMLRDSPLRIRDGQLEAYVRDVLCREVGAGRCQGVRVYVMEIPAFNASMMPNGCMEVWSGLLLRTRNEAELAAVLGHEFGHFELRHSLMAFKAARGATDAMAWISVLGAVTGTAIGAANLALVGSFYRFNRAQETDADLIGFKYMAASNYPSKAAADIWQRIMAERDATMVDRGRKPRQSYTSGFFDSHPTNLDRATYLTAEAAKTPGGTDDRGKEYRAAVAPYLPRLLNAQIKLNDFGGSDYILNSLSADSGWTGDLLFARAELYRARGNPRDLQMATIWFKEAKAAGYAAPELDRDLGLALLRNGQRDEAKQALMSYLTAHPDANDAKMIRTLVAE